jgi:hypothetical protein
MSHAVRVLSAIAERQHGVACRAQGEAADVTRGEIDRAQRAGVLITVAPGVFRLPGAPQTVSMAVAAAALASGGRTSHTTAGRLLHLDVPSALVPLHTSVEADHEHPRVTRVKWPPPAARSSPSWSIDTAMSANRRSRSTAPRAPMLRAH